MTDDQLAGEELDARAAELGIEGRSSMSADEKRDAIAKAEAGDAGAAPTTQSAEGYEPPGEEALGTDKGYIGEKVDPRPNEDYSLESGPDSPSALDAAIDASEGRTEALRASAGDQTA